MERSATPVTAIPITSSPNGATDVITDPQKLLSMYDRGMITETDLVIRLVQAVARGGVTAEVAAVVPSAILDRIREKANTPRDAKLRVIFGAQSWGEPRKNGNPSKNVKRASGVKGWIGGGNTSGSLVDVSPRWGWVIGWVHVPGVETPGY